MVTVIVLAIPEIIGGKGLIKEYWQSRTGALVEK